MCLYVRADADRKQGIGHIMRCLALGQAWQDQKGTLTFISHCESERLKQRIQGEACNYISLETMHPEPADLESVLSMLNKKADKHKDWVVLDGYHFTPDYQKAICEADMRLLVIDDMNHLPRYHADIILNQNSHAQELTYNCDEDTILLLGTSYVFLRREFIKYRNIKRMIPKYARKILLSFGGADSDNVTLKVVQALRLLCELQMDITIVVGPAYAYKDILDDVLNSSGLTYHLLINPPNMVELMAAADLAITAGGGTYWELAFMGVPCLMFILAENQQPVAEELAKLEMVSNLGWYHLLSNAEIATAIHSLALSEAARKNMSRQGQSLISGEGASLTIEAIKSYKGGQK